MFSKDLLLHREGSIYTGPYVSRIFLKLFGHHPVFPAPTVYSSAFRVFWFTNINLTICISLIC